ncbi:hypothetical protein ABPG72_021756 [Tetrahymena utriculariae]
MNKYIANPGIKISPTALLQQIEQLNPQQQQYYNLIDTKREWNEQIDRNSQTKIRIGNKNILRKDIKHMTKKLLDYEGSLKVIQFIIKWKSKAQKYICECHQRIATFKHIMRYKLGMNQESQQQKDLYDMQIDQWKMNEEIKQILKNQQVQVIIEKRKNKKVPTIEEGFAHTLFIPNQTLRELLQNYQKYQIKTIYTLNSNLSSLESLFNNLNTQLFPPGQGSFFKRSKEQQERHLKSKYEIKIQQKQNRVDMLNKKKDKVVQRKLALERKFNSMQ